MMISVRQLQADSNILTITEQELNSIPYFARSHDHIT